MKKTLLTQSLIDQIKQDEGYSKYSYWDHKQYSWGYGTPASDVGLSISKDKAEEELIRYIKIAIGDYIKLFENKDFSQKKKEALINMLYNLGLPTFKKFRKMNKELNKKDINWDKVADEAKDSRWYKQTGNRAKRIIKTLRK